MTLADRWSTELQGLREQGRYRSLRPPVGIDFTSNDYLGYASLNLSDLKHPLPLSGMASRLLRGDHPLWNEVESALAHWHGSEAALMMTSGYSANEGLLSTVIQPGDWVATDNLNHASIGDGLRLVRPGKFLFHHNDLDHLESGLKAEAATRRPDRELFIITESVFSMDGDRAPLPEIVELAEKYGANVIVDEAHATGCYGNTGAGLVDECGLRSRVLATVHTGGKALGVSGAYLCGSATLKEILINRCRHLIFTTAPPPVLAPGWLETMTRVQTDAAGRARLHENAVTLRLNLSTAGVKTLGSTYIVPVIIGEDAMAIKIAEQLQTRGLDVRAIRPPTVPAGTARLRISIHANHTAADIARLSEALIEVLGQ